MPADRPDRLEPAGVATGRVLIVTATGFVLIAATVAVVSTLIAVKHAAQPEAAAHLFPAPQLETSLTPRATASNGHGPSEYRRRPPAARAAEVAPAPDRLAAAMRAVAARGPAAYDPVPDPAPTPAAGAR